MIESVHKIDPADVEQVIGLAAEMAHAEEGRLTVAELEDVARQLDIPDEYVRKAVDVLGRRRKAERRRRVLRARVLPAAALGLVAVLLGLFAVARSGLVRADAAVQAERAQLASVVERQAAVRAMFESRAPDPERDAELAGAENRVRIQRKRYDEAATSYNVTAQGLLVSLVRPLVGAPARAPLSNEAAAR